MNIDKDLSYIQNIQNDQIWSRAIGSESLLASWLNASLLLLGNALLFYHMVTMSQTPDVSHPVAGCIATGFLVVSTLILFVCTSSYRFRSTRVVELLPEKARSRERRIQRWNNMVTTLLCLVFLFVGGIILYGSVSVFIQSGA